jgi:hypothetical protein
MMDGLSKLYRDLLSGSYDCVDRIVLNAYTPTCGGQNPRPIDRHYQDLLLAMKGVFAELGIAA